MLDKLNFKAGPSKGSASLTVDLAPVTVLVGPNNSGKSLALREIEQWILHPKAGPGAVIDQLMFTPWTREDFERELVSLQAEPRPGEFVQDGHIHIQKLGSADGANGARISKETAIVEATMPNNRPRNYYSSYLRLVTLRMDGQSRLSLVNEQAAGDLQKEPKNYLAKLFANRGAREEVRRIVYEAIGKYLVVDPTNIGRLRLRLSARRPTDDREEQGWDERSVTFHRDAFPIEDASDGVRAFVGMVMTSVAGAPSITLVDEPEAFLHPILASRLAKEMARAIQGTNKRLIASTHSASFLMGCVLSGTPMNIVRLTYDGANATARLMPQERLIHLMRNPMLRSVGVLNALFHSAVIVTEADADRAFYQEVNERLLASNDPRGIEGCLFLNAQNKQTVWDIIEPLRMLGIPAAGIVDVDVIKEGGAVWAKPMKGAFFPAISHDALSLERSRLLKVFEATGKDMKCDGGVGLLPPGDREAADNFFNRLEEYGMFVVRGGEVENWLSDLPVSRSKHTWLDTIFETMREDPADPLYVRPGSGDVWDFMGSVSRWIANPSRRGIP